MRAREHPLQIVTTAATGRKQTLEFIHSERSLQFLKFCLVGVTGVAVDMGALFVLADPRALGLNLTFSKTCAAEIALLSNFLWNELWTFRPAARKGPRSQGLGRRLLFFNAVCAAGIVLAVLLLQFFHSVLGWNLYISNLLAIGLVTLWNFGMNARFNWRGQRLTT